MILEVDMQFYKIGKNIDHAMKLLKQGREVEAYEWLIGTKEAIKEIRNSNLKMRNKKKSEVAIPTTPKPSMPDKKVQNILDGKDRARAHRSL